MTFSIGNLLLLIISYLAGSIPFGLITARMMGKVDIRKVGSGNIGTTNVLRSVGKIGGIVTLVGDSMKGFLPVLLAKSWWGITPWTLLVAIAAIAGHNYSIYLKFRGGKGVATSFGVVVALWPLLGLICVFIWILTVVLWRYSSLGALISFAILPILISLSERSLSYVIFALLVTAMIFYRHRENIKRLLAGTERKIGKKSIIVIFLVVLFSGIHISEAAYLKVDIPDRIKDLWQERRIALHEGDTTRAQMLLDEIIKTKYTMGINRIDDISALLVREGYIALENDSAKEAYTLAMKAKEISPSYPPPYYLSAHSLWEEGDIMASISELIRGLTTSWNDFISLFYIAGKVYTVIMIAIGFSALALSGVWLVRFLPVFFHTFREVTSRFITRYFQMAFFIVIISIPLLIGPGWFFLFWLLLIWIYLTTRERIIASFLILLLLMIPILVKYESRFIASINNPALRGLLAIERGSTQEDLLEELERAYEITPENKYLTMAIAYISGKRGDVTRSTRYYNMLLESEDIYTRVWTFTNMGNLFFKMGDYDRAISYYENAREEESEFLIPLFNLSQAYREKLLFQKADELYETARSVDKDKTDEYMALAMKGDGFKVIDPPLKGSYLWSAALAPSDQAALVSEYIVKGFFRIPVGRFPFLVISIIIVLLLYRFLKPVSPMAYFCPECGKVVCGWCRGSRIFGKTCKECRLKSRARATTRVQIVEKRAAKRISFILPGIWQLYTGKIVSGLAISFIFFAGIAGYISIYMDNSRSAFFPGGFSISPWPLLIIISYIATLSYSKYIRIKVTN